MNQFTFDFRLKVVLLTLLTYLILQYTDIFQDKFMI